MKRIFILLLTIAMVGTLAGCGETGQQEFTAPSESSQVPNQTSVETEVASFLEEYGLSDKTTILF